MSIKISDLPAVLAANLTDAAVLPVTDSTTTTGKATVAQLRVSLAPPVPTGETGVTDLRYPVGDIRRYGAVGSNATADGLAIRNAITSAKARGGGVVYVPAGDWYIAEVTAQGIVLPDGVTIEGASKVSAKIHATGTWTDSVVRAEGRDDNNPNNAVAASLQHLTIQMDTSSVVTCLDICGFRKSRFVDLLLGGFGIATGQIAIRLADRNAATTSHKSTFFNEFTSVSGNDAGWGTWIKAVDWFSDVSTNIFTQMNAYCRIAFDFTDFGGGGQPAGSNVYTRHYYSSDSTGTSASHKSSIVGPGIWTQCSFEGFTLDLTATYNLDTFSHVPTTVTERAYVGNLQLPLTGSLVLGGYSPLVARDIIANGVISGIPVTAETTTSLRVSVGVAYVDSWLNDAGEIVVTHTVTGAPHTEYVVLNNGYQNSSTSRVQIQLTAPSASQVALAEADVNNVGVRTALRDKRVLGASYKTVRGLSATATAANNLRGSVTITGVATTAAVTFATAESDTSYYVTAIVSTTSGAIAAGSTRVWVTSKTTAGFTVNTEVAPGGATSVTVDWLLVR